MSPIREYKTKHGRITLDMSKCIGVEEFTDEVDKMGKTETGVITMKQEVKATLIAFPNGQTFPVEESYDTVIQHLKEAHNVITYS